MNYGELKNRVRDLGYVDNTDITENINLLNGSLNSALKTISETVKGVVDRYEYVQTAGEGLTKLDLRELTKVDGAVTFDSLEYVELETDAIRKFTDYTLQLGRIVVFSAETEGTFEFYYKKRVEEVAAWSDDKELPIEYQCEAMLPLLTAYYMWLDDDADIASRWYNEYDSLKTEYKEKKSSTASKARVRTDLWQR